MTEKVLLKKTMLQGVPVPVEIPKVCDGRSGNPFCMMSHFKGEPFAPPPEEEYTPLQYVKHLFDGALIDHIVEHTNLYPVQSTGSSICVRHNDMKMYLGGAGNEVYHQVATNKDVLVQRNQSSFCGRCHVNQPLCKNSTVFLLQRQHQTSSSYSQDHDKLFEVRPIINSLGAGISRGVPLCG